MHDIPDAGLLERFARTESEEAFAELVRRHIPLVYSAAFRHSANPQNAQEITQAVFIILARKAASLGRRSVLSGWLYHTTRLTAANFERAEIRRIHREQEAFMQSTLQESAPEAAWREVAPLLDEAMSRLGTTDRDAVVLRYFENKSLAEVGTALGVEERAAQKRVTRALERLRRFFTKRSVSLTTTVIAGALSANSVQAAPMGLAVTIASTAVKGTLISATLTTVVTGTMKTMTWLKLKFAAGIGAAALLAGGVVTVAVSGTAVIPSGGHTGVTAFSLLEKTPIVANTVFEKELFVVKGVPPEARKQTFSFKRDGDDYLLTIEGGAEIRVGRLAAR